MKRMSQVGFWLCCLLAASCTGRTDGRDPGGPAGSERPLAVSVVAVGERDVARRVEITGTLAAWEEGVVSIEAEGRLVEVRADLGDRVAKGEILARVAAEEYQFRKEQAEAELAAATADLARLNELAAKNMATKQQVDEANRRLQVARTSAGLARKKLQDTVLRSPIEGAVARRLVNPGEYVRIGTPAFQIVNANPLKFRGEVPERFAPDVKSGDPVTAVSSAVPGPSLTGKIVRIGPTVTVETRSFPIEAELDNPDGAVKPGTFCRLSILTGTRARALVVPEQAVVMFAGNPRVFLAKNGKAVETPIEVVGRDGDQVVVGSGLSAGDPVIATGANLLVDGRAVEIRAPASPATPAEGDAR